MEICSVIGIRISTVFANSSEDGHNPGAGSLVTVSSTVLRACPMRMDDLAMLDDISIVSVFLRFALGKVAQMKC